MHAAHVVLQSNCAASWELKLLSAGLELILTAASRRSHVCLVAPGSSRPASAWRIAICWLSRNARPERAKVLALARAREIDAIRPDPT